MALLERWSQGLRIRGLIIPTDKKPSVCSGVGLGEELRLEMGRGIR